MTRRSISMRSLLPATIFAALLVTSALSACGPAVVAGAGTGAVVAAQEERGLSGAFTDANIRSEVSDGWFQHSRDLYNRVNLQIYEGRVLLSGIVPTETMREDAVRLAFQDKDVREVINEIVVGSERDIDRTARDKEASARLSSKFVFAREVRASNYSVRVVDGTVYLLGVARSQTELDRVLAIIRNTPNVSRIANHVLLTDDRRREQS